MHSRRPTANHGFDTVGEDGVAKRMLAGTRCALWGVVLLPVMACSGPDHTDAGAAMDRLDGGTAQVAKEAASSASTDQIGIVQARIDDEDRTWFTLSRKVDGQSSSTAVYVQSGQLGMVNIDAFPEPAFSTTGIFQVKLLFGGSPAPGKSPAVVTISHFPGAATEREPYWTSDSSGSPGQATLETFEIDGDTGRAAATFSGRICLRENADTDPDKGNCKAVSGRFETDMAVRL